MLPGHGPVGHTRYDFPHNKGVPLRNEQRRSCTWEIPDLSTGTNLRRQCTHGSNLPSCNGNLLAATIEAIFTVMGKDEPEFRQCPLGMDKCEMLVVSTKQMVLGLVIYTTSMTVSLPLNYISEI